MIHKHLFALYHADLGSFKELQTVSLQDIPLLHRIKNVLRLASGEQVLLFDQYYHARCRIEKIDKKSIVVMVNTLEKNAVLHPHIIIALPVLKKDAFEQALYSCVELGASEIIPYVSAKTHDTLSAHDKKRAQKIIIAAAEQSKHFAFPKLAQETTLNKIIADAQGALIFFDAQGRPARELIKMIDQVQRCVLMIGPEGDLAPEEKQLLISAGFLFYTLTPTILRAQQALAVGLGLMRSLG